MVSITVNGKQREVQSSADTPLLYVLRNELEVASPQFGCGLAQCGACTVHYDGEPLRCCVMPISAVAGARIVTLEGLGTADKPHPLQQAFIDEQAAQCGYCINGWIMTAAALLEANPAASEDDIRKGLSGLKCRCGTHMSILRAVKLAAKRMAAGSKA